MMWFRRSQQPLIGCEIDARCVRLAQLRRQGGRVVLLAASRPVPAPGSVADMERSAAVSAAIREMLRDGDFAGREAVTCLPNDAVILRTLRLANMPDADLLAAVQWKAAAELRLTAEQVKSQILTSNAISEAGKRKHEVVAVTATLDQLDQHVRTVTEAGLHIHAIDSSTCAIARRLTSAACGAPASPPQLVLELREASATLAIAARGDILFVRPVGGGMEQMERLLGNRLGLPAADAAAVHRLLRQGNDADWPLKQAPADRARLALGDAARMYARDLAREISLSLSYFEEALDGEVPDAAVVVSAEELPEEARSALALQTGVQFLAAEAPAAQWQSPPEVSCCACGAWLTSVGLSQYAEASGAQKEAA